MLWDLLPDEALRAAWVPADALGAGVQATREIAVHNVQTDTLRMEAASFAPPLLGSVGLPQPEAAAATSVVHRMPVAASDSRGDGGGARGGIIALEDGGDLAGLGAPMGGGAGGQGAAGGGTGGSTPSGAGGAGGASTGGLSLSSSHPNRRPPPATAAVHAARARARLERDEDYLRTVLRLAEAAQSGVSESAAFDAAEELGRDLSGLGSYRGNASRVRVVSASRAERWRAAAAGGAASRGGGAVSGAHGVGGDGAVDAAAGGLSTASATSLQAPVRALAWAADGSARLAVGVGPTLFAAAEEARGGHDSRASTAGRRRGDAHPSASQASGASGAAHHHGHHGGPPLGVTFDAARLDAPIAALRASAPILALAFAPRQPTTLAAGDSLGRLTLHDVRMPASGATGTAGAAGHPYGSLLLPTSSMRAAEPSCAHPGGAVAVAWAASRAAGAEVAVAGADGRVTWWDPRNLSAPLEDLDLGEALANGGSAQGGGGGVAVGAAPSGPAGAKGRGAADGAPTAGADADRAARSTRPPLTATCMEHAAAGGPGRFLIGTASGSILGVVRGAAPPRAGGGGRSKARGGKRAAARAAAPRARVASEHRVLSGGASATGKGSTGGGGSGADAAAAARAKVRRGGGGGVDGAEADGESGERGYKAEGGSADRDAPPLDRGLGAANGASRTALPGASRPSRSSAPLPSSANGPIRAVAASAALPGCFFAISGASLRLWRDDLSAPLCRAPPGSAALTALAASPARAGLAIVGDAAGGLEVWDMTTSRARPAAVAPAPRGAGAMTALAWSPAPELAAAGDERGGILLLRVDESLSRPAADTKDVLLAMLERDAAREKAAERGAVSSKKGAADVAGDGLGGAGRATYGGGLGDYVDESEEAEREEMDRYARDVDAARRAWDERRRRDRSGA